MKAIIEYEGVKRQIDGPFSICIGRGNLETLIQCLSEKQEGDLRYGWIEITERPERTPDSPPIGWHNESWCNESK
jgi:hypothetical protein